LGAKCATASSPGREPDEDPREKRTATEEKLQKGKHPWLQEKNKDGQSLDYLLSPVPVTRPLTVKEGEELSWGIDRVDFSRAAITK